MKRLDGGGAMKVLILGASGFVGKNLLLGMPNDWDILATYYTAIDFVEWQKKNCPHIKIMQCNLAIDAHQLNDQHFDVVVSLLANPQPSLSSVHPVADYAHNATTSSVGIVPSCVVVVDTKKVAVKELLTCICLGIDPGIRMPLWRQPLPWLGSTM
ncbi:hypothetical protein LCGC14_2884680, partial [marine sediment metagenome]